MNYIKYIVACMVVLSVVCTSCEDYPIDEEQYFKQVYLVGAYEQMQQKEAEYGGETEFFIAAAIGGSVNTDRDVTLTLGEANQINIDNYNRKHVLTEEDILYEPLPKDWYTISSNQATIQAGNRYVRIPIRIQSDKIDADKRYVIPLKIASVSDYQANEKDTVLMVNVKMVNEYSGSYMIAGKSVEYKDGEPVMGTASPLSTQRNLTALSVNSVRFYHKAELEKKSTLDKSAIVITVNPDNTITLKGWKDLKITESGGTYDRNNKTFSAWYMYEEGSKTYKMEVVFTQN